LKTHTINIHEQYCLHTHGVNKIMTTMSYRNHSYLPPFARVLQKLTNGLVRSGYSRAAHELDSAGMHIEAAKLRNDARFVGGN